MSLVPTADELIRAFKAPAYKVVMGRDDPLLMECQSLNVSMSLQRLYDRKGADEAARDIAQHEFGKVARGLRREVDFARDGIERMAQDFKAGKAIDPIKVLGRQDASGRWVATGFVVDGAIRVQAALRAGIPEVPAWLVAPYFADTPLELMFLHYNESAFSRLKVAERDAILRIAADRYMTDSLGPRSALAFGYWAAERQPGSSPILIAEVTRNRFQVRTPDEWGEAVRLGEGGAPTAAQVAQLQSLRITVPENGRLSPAQIGKVVGVSRAAVEKQFRKLGIQPATKTRAGRGTVKRQTNGHAAPNGRTPDATPELMLRSEIQVVDGRATAQDLLAALKPVTVGFDRAIRQIDDWILKEAPEYQADQARMVWNVIDPFWHKLLTLNQAFHVYGDRYLAARDRATLQEITAEAQATCTGPHRRQAPARARRRGR